MGTTFSPSAACTEFVAGLEYERIPAPVVDAIKKDILDWLGCAIGGAADPSSKPVKALADQIGCLPQASVVGGPKRTVTFAAMSNGYASHILEMDDVDRDSISHPASVIIPPALAMAEYAGKSGKDVITAVVAGFETMLRIGAAMTPKHYEVFHTTATAGVFGSAMASGKLLGLDEAALSWALGNAGTSSAGLWQFLPDGAMSKFLHTGSACANGVTVALLAREGVTGARHILEGTKGFFKGYARQDTDFDLFKDFGEKWRAGLFSFKPYPCCRHTHSAIDAADDMRVKLAGRKVKSIRLCTYNTAMAIAGTRAPKTLREAKFSTTYCVANGILRSKPSEKNFSVESISEAEVKALEAKIEVVIDERINACVPRNWPCRLEVVAEDGEELVSQVWDPKGDPENTLTWDEVETKFAMLTDGIISEETRAKLVALCKDFENLADPSELFRVANESFETRY